MPPIVRNEIIADKQRVNRERGGDPRRAHSMFLREKLAVVQHLTVINQSHQQYLQKDLPDLYVDLSTVGEGYAADHLARLMEQEGISRYAARYLHRTPELVLW